MILETARLRLRPFTPDDLDALHAAIYNDPEAMRYMPGGKPYERDQSRRMLDSFLGHWQMHDFGPWAMIHKADNRLIGQCGLYWIIEFEPAEMEVMYALAKPYWGQGLATEGARASARYAFDHFPIKHLIALAVPDNAASRRVMDKIGMVYQKTTRLWELDLVYYTLLREAFRWDGSPYRVEESE